MGMEVTLDGEIEEEFADYSWKTRLELIYTILCGGCWCFYGELSGEIDPPDVDYT
jgi:hypothetical protein